MKIISGGQTGADRAALDVAIELGMDYGGSVPKGRLAEDGQIDAKYDRLTELADKNYQVRTEQNVVDSDATLIFSLGNPGRGTLYTITMAEKHKRPYLQVNLKDRTDEESVQMIKDWLGKVKPYVLNVAGSRESLSLGIYERVRGVLKESCKR